MLSKLLPVILLLVGAGSGIGAAMMTARPAEMSEPADHDAHETRPAQAKETEGDESEFVKINNQFVVPIIKDDKVAAMIVLSLGLEMSPGLRETVFEREPKLRDLFLRVMFDHANMGGFRGAFTQSNTLDLLKTGLREAAQKELGPEVRDVLIMDIARQDS
ncbi:flagellar basal body-associated FliL family protein [Arenibacterium sp. CAU 1754]